MEEKRYYNIDKESYNNIMRAANLGTDIPREGYNFQATNYVCSEYAKQTQDCNFLDTSVLLNLETKDDVWGYITECSSRQKLIAGEIMVNFEGNPFGFLRDIMVPVILGASDRSSPLQRFVAPLTIYSSDKEDHGVALCIDADKKNNELNIMILEQHAKRDKGNLDFSGEINKTLEYLESVYSFLAEEYKDDKDFIQMKV